MDFCMDSLIKFTSEFSKGEGNTLSCLINEQAKIIFQLLIVMNYRGHWLNPHNSLNITIKVNFFSWTKGNHCFLEARFTSFQDTASRITRFCLCRHDYCINRFDVNAIFFFNGLLDLNLVHFFVYRCMASDVPGHDFDVEVFDCGDWAFDPAQGSCVWDDIDNDLC